MSHVIAAVHYLAGLALLHPDRTRLAIAGLVAAAAACFYAGLRLGGDQ